VGNCNLSYSNQYKISVTAIDGVGNRTPASNGPYLFTFGAFPCAPGYILVPADNVVGVTQPFCVAKYEMKNQAGIAVSTATDAVWNNVTHPNAISACQALGAGYELISNEQWMAIARNIEQNAVNWSSGVVNSGSLNVGHADNLPAAAVLASADDNDACINTGQSCSGSTWDSQRRTHVLSNGQVIWDFSGNVSEWVNKVVTSNKPGATSFVEFNTVTGTAALPDIMFKPNTSALTSTNGVGKMLSGTEGSGGYMIRGGNYSEGSAGRVGVFYINLSSASTLAQASTGFRCTHPAP
jgi:hypothetical protein